MQDIYPQDARGVKFPYTLFNSDYCQRHLKCLTMTADISVSLSKWINKLIDAQVKNFLYYFCGIIRRNRLWIFFYNWQYGLLSNYTKQKSIFFVTTIRVNAKSNAERELKKKLRIVLKKLKKVAVNDRKYYVILFFISNVWKFIFEIEVMAEQIQKKCRSIIFNTNAFT